MQVNKLGRSLPYALFSLWHFVTSNMKCMETRLTAMFGAIMLLSKVLYSFTRALESTVMAIFN